MKPGSKTSEFWLSIAAIAAVAFPQFAPIVGIATQVAVDPTTTGVIGAIVGSYNVGRSYYKAKTGKDLPGVEVQGRQ
jgi:uncharacterized membrane protein